MKKLNQVRIGLLVFTIIGCGVGQAQETTDTSSSINFSALVDPNGVVALSGTNIPSLKTWSDEQLAALVMALDATPTIPLTALPRGGIIGTYWSLQNPSFPPLPGDTIGANVWPMEDGSFLLNDVNYDYNAPPVQPAVSKVAATGFKTRVVIAKDGPGIPGGGGTNTYNPNDVTNTPPDYGTNLWIASPSVSAGLLAGFGSNTLADVEYEIQSRTNLAQSDWQTEGYIYGSELTNWTPLSVPQNGRTNLFLRLKSYVSSDGSGIPDWWEQLYFGTNSVDPNALDSAGDGYTLYQKYQMGIAPSTWATPAAPQGLTVNLQLSSQTAALNWVPAPGPVTGYTVEKSYLPPTAPVGTSPTKSYYSVSGASYQDSLSGNQPDLSGLYQVSYRVQAVYLGGASAWGQSVPLQQTTVTAGILPGPGGTTTLFAQGIPSSAAQVRLVFLDWNALDDGDESFDYTETISVSSFANGQYALPTAWTPPTTDAYGQSDYGVYVASVDASGNPSAPSEVPADWLNLLFYDGRAQMKENLIFQLRAATTFFGPFSFYFPTNYGPGIPYENDHEYDYPATYACAGLYPFTGLAYYDNPAYPGYNGGGPGNIGNGYGGNYGGFDMFLPFEENCLFRNFVFSPSDTDANGNLTTGAGYPNIGSANFLLLPPPTYLFQTNATTLTNLLSATASRWLLPDEYDALIGYTNGIVYEDASGTSILMDGSFSNWFGLPYVSSELLWGNTPTWVTLTPSGSLDASQLYGSSVYLETAQPQFQTVKYCFYRPQYDWLPGSPAFSPTNDSPLLMVLNSGGHYGVTNDLPFLIVPAGSLTQIAGYAKLAVLNGASGIYGYLGQYFTNAYQVDENGNVTTNTTGYVSPYGYYFPTNVGAAALVTMPDLDTGAQGTCMVYSVSLQVDKNHDGTMDTSYNGPDWTSTNSPYVFWCNNNFDRWDDDFPFGTMEQDDQETATCPYTIDTITPDCNYLHGDGTRVIPCTRDLEDFARLWISGVTPNLLAALPAGSTITLNWGDGGNPNPNNPTIDLFQAADADGGIGYLTNETTAELQIESDYNPYIGRLGPGSNLVLNASQFANSWAGNHFIWCGVSNGTGGLNLTIRDANNNMLAQTTAYIQIVDIKQLYERWTVGDKPSVAPLTTAILATEGLPPGASGFIYPSSISTNTPYILYVHGYNMPPWAKDRYAETEYKRLYWQGYQGRFGAFNWPTAQNAAQFGASEIQAWQSAQGLLNKLEDLNAEYPGQVYLTVHSLGNVVAGEALRLATNQVVNTYVAMQGAVASHAYDPTTTAFNLGAYYDGAPDCYSHYWTAGAPCYFSGSAGAGTYLNFFNTNDFALNLWLAFQDAKPSLNPGYSYTAGTGAYYKNFGVTELFFPGDRYDLFANFIQAPCYALGMQPNVGGAFITGTSTNQVNLPSIWPPDLSGHKYGDHIWHSAEFRSDNPQRWQFWNAALTQMKLK